MFILYCQCHFVAVVALIVVFFVVFVIDTPAVSLEYLQHFRLCEAACDAALAVQSNHKKTIEAHMNFSAASHGLLQLTARNAMMLRQLQANVPKQ